MDRATFAREARATLRLAGPVVASQLAQVSLGFVDTVMVGRLGKEALAGVGLGANVFFTFCLLGLGVVLAVGPLVSQAFGAGDDRGVGEGARQGLWASVLVGVPLGLVLAGAGRVLPALGQDPATAALAAEYLGAIAWGVPAFLAFGALRSFAEGVSRPLVVVPVALAGVAVNAFLNDALIHGRYGLPELGAVGTGYASAATTWAMALGLAAVVRFRPALHRYGLLRAEGPHRRTLLELLRVGTPIGLALMVEAGLFSVTYLLMGRIGVVAQAAHQIAINAASVTFMVALGVGLAGGVRVGQAEGAGDRAGVRRAGLTSMALAVGFMGLTAALFRGAPRLVIGVYLDAPANAAVARLAVTLLAFAGFFQVFDGLQVAAGSALRGLKDTAVPMAIGAAAYWGVGLTVGYALAFPGGFGAEGLWTGLVVGLAAAAAGLATRFWRRTRSPVFTGG